MDANGIETHISDKRALGTVICHKLSENIVKLGFNVQTPITLPKFEAAEFTLVTDPFTQTQDLVAYWYDPHKQRMGEIKFYSDGSFYAEYSVMQLHPQKKHVLVDAINAWGKPDNIKLETKFLDIPQ